MRIFARSYRRRRSVMCWMISRPARPKPLTRYQTPSAACFNPQKSPFEGLSLPADIAISDYGGTAPPLLTTCSTVIFDGTRYSRHPRPAHQQGVGFHHAERFTFAEVVGFAAVVMVCGGITTSCSWSGSSHPGFRVKELADIAANLPRILPRPRHHVMPPPPVSSAACSLVSPLTSICTAGRLARWSVTVSLPPVLPTFEPLALRRGSFYFPRYKPIRPRIALIGVNVLRVKLHGADGVIQLPCGTDS
jgi:hypothetical protein